MDNRVSVIHNSLDQFYKQNKYQFDLILLNQVLHEVDMDNNFRINFINEIYSLLNNKGLVLIGESIVSDLFEPERKPQLIEVLHKWQEVCVVSKFYSEKSFRKFISLSNFKQVDLFQELDYYFWVLKK